MHVWKHGTDRTQGRVPGVVGGRRWRVGDPGGRKCSVGFRARGERDTMWEVPKFTVRYYDLKSKSRYDITHVVHSPVTA